MDDQLRRRSVGAPAARSLLLTVLGEYVLPREEGVWQEALVAALVALGSTPQAARQALARTTRDGWLAAERRGRRAHMRLTERSIGLLHAGAQRIYSFGEPWEWDERWLLVALRVPERQREVRNRLRTQLAWAGMGSLGGGLWLTPHVEREADLTAMTKAEPHADLLSFVANLGTLAKPETVIHEAWDLDAVAERYRTFIADFGRLRPTSDEAIFRAQTTMVHAWRKFPFLDPDLPAELLPARWPLRRAHKLFHDRHASWQVSAQAHFASLGNGGG